MNTSSGKTRKCLYIINRPNHPAAPIGGGGKSMLTLWQALARHGWQADVICPVEGALSAATKRQGTPCQIHPLEQPSLRHPLRTARQVRHWMATLSSHAPDIIHANAPDAARSIMLAAAAKRLKVACHVRMPMDAELARWQFRRLPKPAAFIFNSQSNFDESWPHLAMTCPASQAFVVHNAVDLTAFQPAPAPPAPPYRIGIIGHFTPAKAHEDFLLVARTLLGRKLPLEFLVVGDDALQLGRRATLEQMVRDLGIHQAVKFLGHRDDIPEILNQLHIVVLTSHQETFGRVLIEAMACGRPVVATRTGGIPEIVTHEHTGLLAPVGNIEEISAAIERLIMDRCLYRKIADSATKEVQSRFSVASHSEHIIDIYSNILAKRK